MFHVYILNQLHCSVVCTGMLLAKKVPRRWAPKLCAYHSSSQPRSNQLTSAYVQTALTHHRCSLCLVEAISRPLLREIGCLNGKALDIYVIFTVNEKFSNYSWRSYLLHAYYTSAYCTETSSHNVLCQLTYSLVYWIRIKPLTRGGSTLGPGGHRPPQMLARPPQIFWF